MNSKNHKDSDEYSILEPICYIAQLWVEGGFVFIIFVLIIVVFVLIYNVIRWLLRKSADKNAPKIKEIIPDTMKFHVVSKQKMKKILIIDSLLIVGLCILSSINIVLDIFLVLAVFGITCLFMITCDMHAIISADENNLYISYDYLFYKKKEKVIPLNKIKKIIFTEDKIKIITKFRHITLVAEKDSEAYMYLFSLKQRLEV